ncbi:DUF485 domain-containing protein [Brevibacillus fluminis]|uniref:DUF485 domain-containing protein n=1 Tax=Brevibacillus fluminis TaxID=511487 RepID=A0A3M8DAE2_9BACL|nr:DUF485 domain-containing protein [Brevibacillus fluminis]RNB85110.1 DUF485 domain-containing protein [Brevibacillus fluminis]
MAQSTAGKQSQQKGSSEQKDRYTAIVQSQEFKRLLAAKKAFIIPLTLFFFIFYFALPLMTAYSKVLNTPFYGSITWAWVFAFAQFIMTWALCMIYTRKAGKFDQMVNEIKQKWAKGGDSK